MEIQHVRPLTCFSKETHSAPNTTFHILRQQKSEIDCYGFGWLFFKQSGQILSFLNPGFLKSNQDLYGDKMQPLLMSNTNVLTYTHSFQQVSVEERMPHPTPQLHHIFSKPRTVRSSERKGAVQVLTDTFFRGCFIYQHPSEKKHVLKTSETT